MLKKEEQGKKQKTIFFSKLRKGLLARRLEDDESGAVWRGAFFHEAAPATAGPTLESCWRAFPKTDEERVPAEAELRSERTRSCRRRGEDEDRNDEGNKEVRSRKMNV